MTTVAGTRRARAGWLPVLALSLGLVTSGCHRSSAVGAGQPSPDRASWARIATLDLVAHHVFPRDSMGGISGLAHDQAQMQWLALSDSRITPLWLTLGVTLGPNRVSVETLRSTAAQPATGTAARIPDLEAIAVLPTGQLLIGSEGNRVDGVRQPATIWIYDRQGHPVSSVAVPDQFRPEAPGQAPHGARDNHGFEGLAVDAPTSRVWAVAEAPLLQDDELATFDRGARTRLLELALADRTLTVTRQLIYPIEAVGRTAQPPPSAVVVDQGVSELTLLPGGVLVSLERAFVRDLSSGWATNVIRLFRVEVEGADDVSGAESLRDMPTARPVRKRLLADLSAFASRLDPRLRALDNFEAAAPGPPTADGRPTLLLMTDDNFSQRQITALVVMAGRK